MGSEKVLLFNLGVLLLMLFLLAASARDPLVGEVVGGKQLRDCGPDCCDDCRYDEEMDLCSCWDRTKHDCIACCRKCVCDEEYSPVFCRCADPLASCPPTCTCTNGTVGEALNTVCVRARAISL